MDKGDKAIARLVDKIDRTLKGQDDLHVMFEALAVTMRRCAMDCGPLTAAKARRITDDISDLVPGE